MSAIFGIWHLYGDVVERQHIEKMQENVIQYGRAQQEIYLEKNIGLGCCLNRFGVHSGAEVPIYVDELQETMLIGDVQIYNREELIDQYGLSENENISNQALLMEAYKKWGDQCPTHINGDFAFAIWDKQKQQLFVARDHLGVRPLYYCYSGSSFAFSTDYRALLSLPFVEKQLNEKKLYSLITATYQIDPEATYFAQIKKLLQAHVIKIDEQGLHKKKYWTPGAGKKIVFKTEKEYNEALYAIVDDAIKRRICNTKEPIGAELSGGLDSSVITVLANRELCKKDKKLVLFSWSPSFAVVEKQRPRDERELIEAICRQEGLDCIYYDPNKVVQDASNKTIQPDGGSGEVFDHELQEMSANGVKTVLTGWGGDQGISHRANLFELFLNGYWGAFLKEAKYLAKGSPLRFIKILISNTVMQFFGPFSYFGTTNQGVPRMVTQEFAKKMKKQSKKNILYFNVDPVKHLESGNIQTRTELTACLGAEYDVQYLFPFLDYRVVDFAMSIPRHLFYKQGINRYVYRKAFERILPKEVCYYTYKDDIVRVTFLQNKTLQNVEEQESTIYDLNRELFAKYIDLDKVTEIIKKQEKKDDLRLYQYIRRQTQVLYNIQRILAEVGK